jgi:DNA polymerase III epsilon subunit family exonuclease
MGPMQLAIDSLDRLVGLVEDAGGRLRASEAAREVFALPRVPEGLARTLLLPLVNGDARLVWRGLFVALASAPDLPLERAAFVVFDLETTGLAVASARICEIGAVRLRGLQPDGAFTTLVAPGVPLPRPIGRLTGLSDEELRTAPRVREALAGLVAFAADAVLVAHNARFDVGFVNRELDRLTGKRLAVPVIDTVPLARNLLRGRIERTSLAALAYFFGTAVQPCHRALPDAEATAEVFLRLVEIAQDRGASTLSELEELAAPRPRRIHGKRRFVRGAPSAPGVYLFRDRDGRVLYVGKARDLRARLRTYFQSERQRPTVEAALDRLDRIEWRQTGSELAAALEEVALIRELRPAANTRTPQPERYVYLHRRGERVVVSRLPSRHGPLRRRTQAQRAARALRGCSSEEFEHLVDGGALERLRDRLAGLTEPEQELEARELRRRIVALDRVVAELARLERLRRLELRIVTPGLAPGTSEAYLVCGGRVERSPRADDLPPPPPDALVEADHLDRLLVVDAFLRRPPSELTILPLGHREHRDAA